MKHRRVVFSDHFLDQAALLPPRTRDRAFGYVMEIAAEEDPALLALPDPDGIPHVWRVERFDLTVSVAVYDDVLRVDALTVRANG
ncbi:hypothetical protein [Marinactinospora rubrisoli]|uniref:Uncharacterized protein n=1 Tax=Marinactinospora rubrisoli TaxID=2715399 RepID=A0ABW2KQ52_9ACTN